MKCLLDLDGVLVDFVKGACDLHKQPSPYLDPSFSSWLFEDKFGISKTQFYKPMGREFWGNLSWMEDGQEILALVERKFGRQNICLLTSPVATEGCIEGKLAWIARHMPEYKRSFLVGPRKEFCAHSRAVLIDDRNENIDDFVGHGGCGILVPRPWNRHCTLDTIHYIQDSLASYEELECPCL